MPKPARKKKADTASRFEKYRGLGNLGSKSGRKSILQIDRLLRGL